MFAASNYPGSWHDSKHAASSGIYDLLLSGKTLSRFVVLTYSALRRVSPHLSVKIVRARTLNGIVENNERPKSTCLAAVDVPAEIKY